MFLLLSALQKLVNRGEAEQEEPEGEVAATSSEQASQPILANINRQRSEDAVSKDGTASQCSVRSIGVESTGYLSDDEGDDDYIHIFNTEYSFSDRESDDGDRASFRSFRWSSSKQSLTSLLETVSEEAPLADEASEIAEEENASQHQSALHLEPDIEKEDLEILYASSVSVSQDKNFEFTESDGEFVHLSKPSHTDASLGNAEVQTFSLMTTNPLINDSNNNDVVNEAHKPKIEPEKPQFFIESESSFTCLESEGLFLEKVTECDENEIPESYRACIRSIDVTQDPVEEESILEIIIQEESESKTDEWRTTRNEETSPFLAPFDSSSSTTNEIFSAREEYLKPEGFGMEHKSSKRCCLEEREEKILHTHEDYQILEMVTVEARKDRSELRNKHEEKPTLDEVTAKHEDCKEHNVKRLEQDKENQKEDKENKHGCDNDVNVDKRSNAEQETRTSCVESLVVVELLPIMPVIIDEYVIERREEKKTIGQNEELSKIENKKAEEQLVREDCFSTEATYDKGETSERYTQFEQKMQTNGDKITKKEGSKEWVHSGVAGNQKALYFCELQEIPLERYAVNMNTKDQCTTIEVKEIELENGNHATHFMVDRLNKFDDEKMHNIFKERKTEEACKEGGRKIAKISENQDLTQMGLDEVCELQPITVENMQVMKYDDSNSLHEKKTVKHSLQRKKEEKIEEERCLELPLVTEKERTMVEKFSQCRNEIPHCQESNKDTDNFDDKETKKHMKMELSTDKDTSDETISFHRITDMSIEEYLLFCTQSASEKAPKMNERQAKKESTSDKGTQDEADMTIEDYLMFCSAPTSEERKCTEDMSTDKGTQDEADMTIEDYILLCSTPTSEEATETNERKCTEDVSTDKGFQEETYMTIEDYLLLCSTSTSEEATATKEWKYTKELSTDKGTQEESDMTIEDYLLLCSTPMSEESTETKERKCTKELRSNKGSQEAPDMTIEDYLLLCSTPTSEEATDTKERKCTEDLSTNKGSQEAPDMTIEDYLLLCSSSTSEATETKERKCTEDLSTNKGSQEAPDMTIEDYLLLCSTSTSEEATETKERKCTEELRSNKGSQEAPDMTIEDYLLLCSTPTPEEATDTKERKCTEELRSNKGSQEEGDMTIEDCLLLCSKPTSEEATNTKERKCTEDLNTNKGSQEAPDMTIEDYLLLCSTPTSEEATDTNECKCTEELRSNKGSQEEPDMTIEDYLLIFSTLTSEEATDTKERKCTEELSRNKGSQEEGDMTIEDCLLLCSKPTSEEATNTKERKCTEDLSTNKGSQEATDMTIEDYLLLCSKPTSEEATNTKERKCTEDFSTKKGSQEEGDMTIEDYLLLCSTPTSEEATETKERKCTEDVSTDKGFQEETYMTIEDYLLLCSTPTSEEATNTKERKCTEELRSNKGSQEEPDMTIEDYLLICSTLTSEEATETKERKCTEELSRNKGSQEEGDMTIEDCLLLCSKPTSEEATNTKERKCTEDLSTNKGSQETPDMTIEDYLLLCSTPPSEEATETKERKCTEELSTNKGSQEEGDMTIEDYLRLCSTPTSEEAKNTKVRKCTEDFSTSKGSQEEADMTIEENLLLCSTTTSEEATEMKERKCTEELSRYKGSQEEANMTIEEYLLLCSTPISEEATKTSERQSTEKSSTDKDSQEDDDMIIEDCLLLCSTPAPEQSTKMKEMKFPQESSKEKGIQEEADMTIEDYLLLSSTSTSEEATETKERKCTEDVSTDKGFQEETDMTIEDYLLICSTPTSEEATNTKERKCTEELSRNKGSQEEGDMTIEDYLLLCSKPTSEEATNTKERKCTEDVSTKKGSQEEGGMTIEDYLLLCSTPTSEEATDTKERKCTEELRSNKGSQEEPDMTIEDYLLICSTLTSEEATETKERKCTEELSRNKGSQEEGDMTIEDCLLLCSTFTSEEATNTKERKCTEDVSTDKGFQEETDMTIEDYLLLCTTATSEEATETKEWKYTKELSTDKDTKDEADMTIEDYLLLCTTATSEEATETKERKFPQESSKEKGTQEEADMTIKNYLLLCSTSTTEEATKTKDRQCTEKSSANKDSHEKADMTNENYLLLCSTATPEPATKMKEMKYPQELSKGKCAQEEAYMTIEENLLLCSTTTSEEATETKETKFPQELSKGKGAQNGITESQREASMIVNAFSTPIFQHSYNMNKEQSAEDLSTDNGGRNRTKEIQEEDMTREGYIHLCSKPDNDNESRKNKDQSATVSNIDHVYRIQIINAQEEAGMSIGDHLLRYSKPVIDKGTKANEGQLTEISNTKNVGKDAMLGSQGETEMFTEEYSNLCLQKVAERKSEEQSPLQAISSNLFSKDIYMSLTDKKDPIQDCVELYSYNMAENALEKNEIRSWGGSSKPKKDELLFENIIKEFVPEIREGEDMQSIDGGWWKKDRNTVIREGHEGDLNSKEKLMTEAEEGRTKAQNMADKDKGDKTTEARKRKASTGSLVESGTLTELVQKRKGSKEECKRFSTCEEDTVRETIKDFEQLRKYEESSIKNYTESFPHSGHTQRKHSASEMGKTDLLTIKEEVRHNQENTLCKEVSDSKVPPDEDITPWMHASQSVRGTYSEAKKNKGSGSNWSNDQGDFLLHAKIFGKRLNDEDTNDKEAIMRLPSFSVLEGDLEDFSQLSRASPCLRIEESINTSVSEKELATNSYEQHNNVPKDENNSEIGHVKIKSNICEQPCLDNKKHQISEQPLNKIEQDTKENRKSPGALFEKTGKKSEKIPVESSKTTEVVFYSPAFGNCKEHSFIQPVQIGGEFNIRGSIFSREECGVSSYQLDLKPIESLPEQYELRQAVKKIFFIAKSFEKSGPFIDNSESSSCGTPMPKQSDNLEATGDNSDKRHLDTKTKRLYTRQKAFDKFSFQNSEEHEILSGIDARTTMNRTDSEKLDEQRRATLDAEGNHRVLTNAISTEEPEVGADITVVLNADGKSKKNKLTRQEKQNNENDGIESYVILEDDAVPLDEQVPEEKTEEMVQQTPEGSIKSNQICKKDKRKRKTKSIRRKKTLRQLSKKDRQQSEDNDTDVIFDAVTDLDMDAFDTGMDTAFNTENERELHSNESFEEISMEHAKTEGQMKRRGSNLSYGEDCEFEMATKPEMSDSHDDSSDSEYSLVISEDDSVTVVMGFDKDLNALTIAPTSLVPPKAKSGYSSELEDDAEEDAVPKRKREHKKKLSSTDDPVDRQVGGTDQERQSCKSTKAADTFGIVFGQDLGDKNKEKMRKDTNKGEREDLGTHILEYEVDWETALDDKKSAVVTVDPETNVIKVGTRKGLIKGSRMRGRENDNLQSEAQSSGLPQGKSMDNLGKSIEEMSVVFMKDEDGFQEKESSKDWEQDRERRKRLETNRTEEGGDVDQKEDLVHIAEKEQEKPIESFRESRKRREMNRNEDGEDVARKEEKDHKVEEDKEKEIKSLRERRRRREIDRNEDDDDVDKKSNEVHKVEEDQEKQNGSLRERGKRREQDRDEDDDDFARKEDKDHKVEEDQEKEMKSMRERRKRREQDRDEDDDGFARKEEKDHKVEEDQEKEIKSMRERRKRREKDRDEDGADFARKEEKDHKVEEDQEKEIKSMRERRKRREQDRDEDDVARKEDKDHKVEEDQEKEIKSMRERRKRREQDRDEDDVARKEDKDHKVEEDQEKEIKSMRERRKRREKDRGEDGADFARKEEKDHKVEEDQEKEIKSMRERRKRREKDRGEDGADFARKEEKDHKVEEDQEKEIKSMRERRKRREQDRDEDDVARKEDKDHKVEEDQEKEIKSMRERRKRREQDRDEDDVARKEDKDHKVEEDQEKEIKSLRERRKRREKDRDEDGADVDKKSNVVHKVEEEQEKQNGSLREKRKRRELDRDEVDDEVARKEDNDHKAEEDQEKEIKSMRERRKRREKDRDEDGADFARKDLKDQKTEDDLEKEKESLRERRSSRDQIDNRDKEEDRKQKEESHKAPDIEETEIKSFREKRKYREQNEARDNEDIEKKVKENYENADNDKIRTENSRTTQHEEAGKADENVEKAKQGLGPKLGSSIHQVQGETEIKSGKTVECFGQNKEVTDQNVDGRIERKRNITPDLLDNQAPLEFSSEKSHIVAYTDKTRDKEGETGVKAGKWPDIENNNAAKESRLETTDGNLIPTISRTKEEADESKNISSPGGSEERATEIFAIAETMLHQNLPLDHTPEKSDWEEHIKLRETGLLDEERMGRSLIREKITMQNAFDEELLKEAEKHAYWDRVLEIKRARRMSVQKSKDMAKKMKAGGTGIEETTEEIDTVIEGEMEEEREGDLGSPSKERNLPTQKYEGNEQKYTEDRLELSMETGKKQNMKGDLIPPEEENELLNETIASNINVTKIASLESAHSITGESTQQSCEDIPELSPSQVRREEKSHKKGKKRDRGRPAEKKDKESEEVTKKVPLIKITEPSTEVYFDSQDLDIDDDDEKFIEEVLKKLEERKLERKKQREMEQQEEESRTPGKKPFDNFDDLDFDESNMQEDETNSDSSRRRRNESNSDNQFNTEQHDADNYSGGRVKEKDWVENDTEDDDLCLEEKGFDVSSKLETSTPQERRRQRREARIDSEDEKQRQGKEVEKIAGFEEKRQEFKEKISDSLIANYDENESVDQEIDELERNIDKKIGKILSEIDGGSEKKRTRNRPYSDGEGLDNTEDGRRRESCRERRQKRTEDDIEEKKERLEDKRLDNKGDERDTAKSRREQRKKKEVEKSETRDQTERAAFETKYEEHNDDENTTSMSRRDRRRHGRADDEEQEITTNREATEYKDRSRGIKGKLENQDEVQRRRERKSSESEEETSWQTATKPTKDSSDTENRSLRRRSRRRSDEFESKITGEAEKLETYREETALQDEIEQENMELSAQRRSRRTGKRKEEKLMTHEEDALLEADIERNNTELPKPRRSRRTGKGEKEEEEQNQRTSRRRVKEDQVSSGNENFQNEKERDANTKVPDKRRGKESEDLEKGKNLEDANDMDGEIDNDEQVGKDTKREKRGAFGQEEKTKIDAGDDREGNVRSRRRRKDPKESSDSEKETTDAKGDEESNKGSKRRESYGNEVDKNDDVTFAKERRARDARRTLKSSDVEAKEKEEKEVNYRKRRNAREQNTTEENVEEQKEEKLRRPRRSENKGTCEETTQKPDSEAQLDGEEEMPRRRRRAERNIDHEEHDVAGDNTQDRRKVEDLDAGSNTRPMRESRIIKGVKAEMDTSDIETKNVDSEYREEEDEGLEKRKSRNRREINNKQQHDRIQKNQENETDDVNKQGTRRRRGKDKEDENQSNLEDTGNLGRKREEEEMGSDYKEPMADDGEDEELHIREKGTGRRRRNKEVVVSDGNNNMEEVEEETENSINRRRLTSGSGSQYSSDDKLKGKTANTRRIRRKSPRGSDEESLQVSSTPSDVNLTDEEETRTKQRRSPSSTDHYATRPKEEKENFDEMVGVPRSPSSRNSWKGGDTSRSETDRSEAESDWTPAWQNKPELGLTEEDLEMVGRRRRSSSRNEWRSGDERSETESIGHRSRQEISDVDGNLCRKKEEMDRIRRSSVESKSSTDNSKKIRRVPESATEEESREQYLEKRRESDDKYRKSTKAEDKRRSNRIKKGSKLGRPSKESLDQMVGCIRSSSTRDEWKRIQEE